MKDARSSSQLLPSQWTRRDRRDRRRRTRPARAPGPGDGVDRRYVGRRAPGPKAPRKPSDPGRRWPATATGSIAAIGRVKDEQGKSTLLWEKLAQQGKCSYQCVLAPENLIPIEISLYAVKDAFNNPAPGTVKPFNDMAHQRKKEIRWRATKS